MNFHVGFLSSGDDLKGAVDQSKKLDFVRESSLVLLGNAQNVAEVVLSGVCHRYPDLKFVSVENGAGWLPFLAESMDWQWLNVGAHKDYPDRLLPSEYVQPADLRHVLVRAGRHAIGDRPPRREPDVRDRLPARHQPLARPGLGVPEPARRHGAARWPGSPTRSSATSSSTRPPGSTTWTTRSDDATAPAARPAPHRRVDTPGPGRAVGSSLLHRAAFYIGGAWVSPSARRHSRWCPRRRRKRWGPSPSPRPATSTGPWTRHPGRFTGVRGHAWRRASVPGSWRGRPSSWPRRTPTSSAVTTDEMGCAVSQAPPAQTGLVAPVFPLLLRAPRSFDLERTVVSGDRAGTGHAGAGRRRRGHHPLERARSRWPPGRRPPRWRPGAPWCSSRPPRPRSATSSWPRRSPRPGVPPGCSTSCRRPRGGRAPGDPPRHRQGRLHRLDRGREAHHEPLRGPDEARLARARREVGGRPARRCRPLRRHPGVVRGGMHLSGQVCGAHTRVLVPPVSLRRGGRDRRGSGRRDRRRRSPRSGDRGRAAGGRAPAGPGGGLHRAGRRGRARGSPAADAPGPPPQGLVRGADDPRRVTNHMRVAREEIFGPVLSVIPHDGEDDACASPTTRATGSPAGCGAADPGRALSVARRLRTGSVAVNGQLPALPARPLRRLQGVRHGQRARSRGPARTSSSRAVSASPRRSSHR